MPETIQLSMTWETAVNIIVHLLTSDPDPKTIQVCREELLRLAKAVDSRNNTLEN
jgi:hypothetical protein